MVDKDGKPNKEMRASIIRMVQRQHKAYVNSLKAPFISEASINVKFEKVTQRSRIHLTRRLRGKWIYPVIFLEVEFI